MDANRLTMYLDELERMEPFFELIYASIGKRNPLSGMHEKIYKDLVGSDSRIYSGLPKKYIRAEDDRYYYDFTDSEGNDCEITFRFDRRSLHYEVAGYNWGYNRADETCRCTPTISVVDRDTALELLKKVEKTVRGQIRNEWCF